MPARPAVSPSRKALDLYAQSLADFAHLGVTHETAVRSAFQVLLDDCARQIGWKLVPEYPLRRPGSRQPLRADGALVDGYNLAHGLWEAKDTGDDLEREIKKKLALGYPPTNLLFQAPGRAVLYQNGQRVLDTPLTEPGQLTDTLRAFLGYEEPAIAEWEKASVEFKERIAEHGEALKTIITKERKRSAGFRQSFLAFFELCRGSLNPELSEAAVEEMLIQHILTERIFKRIFNVGDFMRRNVIAREIESVVESLTASAFSREDFLRGLDKFYVAIEHAAGTITDFSEKQKFLNTVYERFFQGFSVAVADTHGIVYTPQPIVDFMVRSVDHLLKAEFGQSLASPGVHLLDPFTGTGNFVVNAMQHIPATDLPAKYATELHANEVMLLPYYVASMNIEHAYFEAVGKYEPFEGICLVDTFTTAEKRQGELNIFNEENSERVARQRKAPIFVCIGNPPYNAWQHDENDNNRNRPHPEVDRRVEETYGADSKATLKNSLSDPYIKAIRWASDRIGEEGVIAFVTNNHFLDGIATDGVRKHLSRDFHSVYHLDFKGNARTSGERRRREKGNIFDDAIRVGVGITFLIRKKHPKANGRAAIHLWRVADYLGSAEKKSILTEFGSIENVPLERV